MAKYSLSPSEYRVTIWDLVMIVSGAIALIAAGLIQLGFKAYNNALNPLIAEAVAKSIIDYRIPGGSQGKFGIKVAGVKLALVNSKTSPPDVEIFIMKSPLNKDTERDEEEENSNSILLPQTDVTFQVTSLRTANMKFCGQNVSVKIEEGQQTLENQTSPVYTVQYSASTTLKNEKLTVIVQASGKNAKQKALTVFQSLKCK